MLIFSASGHATDWQELDRVARVLACERVVGQQVLSMTAELSAKAGIKEQVTLFSNPKNSGLGVSRDRYGNIRIVLHRPMFSSWPMEALKGVIAHELGHVVAGHKSHWDAYDRNEQAQMQTEANAYAIRLAGKDAVRSFMVHYGWQEKDAEEEIARAERKLSTLPDPKVGF